MTRHLPLLTLLLGCSPDGVDETFAPVTDPGLDGEAPQAPWTLEQMSEAPGGLHTRLAIAADGTRWAAWWTGVNEVDGVCEEVQPAPPPRMRQDLIVARDDGTGWQLESLDRPAIPLTPPGLGLALTAEGQPVVAWTGGEPEGTWCGGHDAMIATLDGGWQVEVAAATSGEAAAGQPASDAGYVVGLWPTVAAGPDGLAVAYRDIHFGALQRDDQHRADAELALRSESGWAHIPIDVGEGAGERGALIFDAAGRPVLFHAVPVAAQAGSRKGLWATRGDAWERVQLHEGEVPNVVSAVAHPNGGLSVAFYAPDDARAWWLHLEDPADFANPEAWQRTPVGDPAWDEGQYIAIALSGDTLVGAWRRCRLASRSGPCDPNVEEVRFASWDGEAWQGERVAASQGGACGEHIALAIEPDGRPVVAWRCDVQDDSGWSQRPFVATRREAP